MKTALMGLGCSLVLLVLCGMAAGAQNGDDQEKYRRFSKCGLAFDYPAIWEERSGPAAALMRAQVQRDLRASGAKLQEFALIVDPNMQILLMVLKYSTPEAVKPAELVEERKEQHEEAIQAGDSTKVNYVKETTIAKIPAVEEDFERTEGQRVRKFSILDGTTVFEISFVAKEARDFPEYSPILDRLVASMAVVRETDGSESKRDPK